MNTLTKRACKVVSLYFSYLTAAVVVIFIGNLLSNRGTIPCTPYINSISERFLRFTPNLDIRKSINYNVKEVFIYLTHQIDYKEKKNEQIVWSTLAKKENNFSFDKPIVVFNPNSNRLFTEGEFILKATYFPYIGVIKNKTFKVFDHTHAIK